MTRTLRDTLFSRVPRLGVRLGHGPDNALLVIYEHAYALAAPAPGNSWDFLALLIPG